VSKATVYGHFPSKEDLLAAIFHRTMTLVEEGLRDIERRGAPPAEQLRQVIRHQVRTVVAERSFLTVFFSEEPNLPARLARSIARRKAGYDRAVQTIIERGVRSRAFAVREPRLLVWALLGMSNWVYRWYKPAGAWDADVIADAFIALLEPGYLARPTSRVDLSARVTRLERTVATLGRRSTKRPAARKHKEGRPRASGRRTES
jgi:TetR/AcrR family transcriptional regulator, cholesterol catabolism regulator